MKYVNLSILLFCIGAYIYYVNNSHLTRKDIIFTNIFNGVSLFFVGLMIYFVVMYGFNKGLYHTLLSWCIFVVATPIPEAGLIISVPLKNLLNIQLDYTQLFVSLFALIYIVYSYIYLKKYMKESKEGRFIAKILELFEIKIFILSIFASISISYLINHLIDYVLYDNKYIFKRHNLMIFILSIAMIMYYFHVLIKIL
tara:strand:+ start:14 stop:607 length:594 start_codon:yes stop_codon:yes gene_type:complete